MSGTQFMLCEYQGCDSLTVHKQAFHDSHNLSGTCDTPPTINRNPSPKLAHDIAEALQTTIDDFRENKRIRASKSVGSKPENRK